MIRKSIFVTLITANYPTEDNFLHADKVVRKIFQRGSKIFIQTEGEGINRGPIRAKLNDASFNVTFVWNKLVNNKFKAALLSELGRN